VTQSTTSHPVGGTSVPTVAAAQKAGLSPWVSQRFPPFLAPLPYRRLQLARLSG
jgi:hypothetical protein